MCNNNKTYNLVSVFKMMSTDNVNNFDIIFTKYVLSKNIAIP